MGGYRANYSYNHKFLHFFTRLKHGVWNTIIGLKDAIHSTMTLKYQVSEGVYFFMKRVRIPQIEVIQSADGQEFADRFNRTIREAFLEADDRFEPKYTIEHTDGMFTSIITTSTVHEEMDSVEDEYKAQGISYRCKHCPYCDVPYDKRIKWCECSVEQRSTNKESPACERFYRHLKDGIIEAIER